MAAQFWRYAQPSDGCWIWTGPISTRTGYARFKAGGREYRAHRVSYEIHFGSIPDELIVCHHCDNPPCTNPAHLFLGTHADNAHDRDRKGRTTKGDQQWQRAHPERRFVGERHWTRLHPDLTLKGERNGNARLSPEDVVQIRTRFARAGTPFSDLADEFGVTQTTIRGIINRRIWKHL